jgi:hypothetical protein
MRADQVQGLMEAYSQVYETPEVLNEEVVEENVEQIDEMGQARARSTGQTSTVFRPTPSGSGSRRGAAPVPTSSSKPAVTPYKSRFAGARDAAFAKASKIKGSPVVGSKPDSPAPATTPKPVATSAPKPTATPTPAKPAGSAMDQWAKANPKLAAAKAERDRTRGTSATTNPLMKDMKSSLPAPKAPATSTAKTGFDLAKKGVNLAAGVDIFDLVKGHLLDEGYAETEENALVMMANMSEEWRESIVQEVLGEGKKEFPHKKVDRQVYDAMDSGETAGDSGDSDKEERDYNRAEKMRSVASKHGGKSRVKEEVDINEKMEKWIQKVIDESSKTDDGTRARIKMFAGKKGISFEPGPKWDPSANRGKGAHLSDKQMEKQRRKKLRQEDLEAWVDELIAEGYDLSEYTWEEVAEIYAQELELSEAQRARENPEGHDKEDRKYEKVRGEKTPMPPRGDKRREDFEKWYRANVR